MEERIENAAGFLLGESDANPWAVREIIQHSVDFAWDGYSEPLFERLCIERPQALDSAVTKRKAEFLAGRYCATRVLDRLGSPATVDIGQDRCPVWPASIAGSISHSDDKAIAVAASADDVLGLGIDIEKRMSPALAREVQPQIVNASELRQLQSSAMTPEEALTLIFSAKESFFKALYPSVNAYFGFETIAVCDIDVHAREVHFVLQTPLAGGRWSPGCRFTAKYRTLGPDAFVTLVLVRTP